MAQGPSQGTPERTKPNDQLSYEEEMELRRKTTAEAMKLWWDKAETYRIAPLEYKFLAAERRKYGVYPLNLVSRAVLKEYPHIEFFYCLDEHSAQEYLSWLSTPDLVAVVDSIVDMIELNPAYIGINRKIIDLRYLVNHGSHDVYCYNLKVGHRGRPDTI